MTCPTCRGKGVIKCHKCGGHGKLISLISSVTCTVCQGQGLVKCPNCGGKGQV
jgi:hypothetical protein